MNTLNLGSDDEPVVKKKSNTRNLKIALGLAAVILIPTIGSTLAATISITGTTVEFGQGVAATAACDGDGITITATSALSGADFNLGVVTVSGIAPDCDEKFLTIKVLDSLDAALTIGDSIAYCKIDFDSSGQTFIPAECGTISAPSTPTSFSFTTFNTAVPAADVVKFTIESSTT